MSWLERMDEFYHRHPWPGGGLLICDVYEKRVTGLPWSRILRERFMKKLPKRGRL